MEDNIIHLLPVADDKKPGERYFTISCHTMEQTVEDKAMWSVKIHDFHNGKIGLAETYTEIATDLFDIASGMLRAAQTMNPDIPTAVASIVLMSDGHAKIASLKADTSERKSWIKKMMRLATMDMIGRT